MTPKTLRRILILQTLLCLGVGAVGGMLVMSALPEAEAEPEPSPANPATATYGDTAENFVIPYDGYLMLDSTPLSGAIDLEFRLYEEDAGTIATTAEWTEQQTVQGYNGRFSVGLGTTTRLNEDLLDADQLFLEIAIVNADGTTTALGGYQAIEPVPYAIWSAHAANLSVAGNATVGGDLTASGVVTLGNNDGETVTIAAPLSATGTINTITGSLNTEGSVTLGNALADTTTVSGGLTVAGTSELKSANLAGHLTVTGNSTLGNDASDTVTVPGTASITTLEAATFKTNAVTPASGNTVTIASHLVVDDLTGSSNPEAGLSGLDQLFGYNDLRLFGSVTTAAVSGNSGDLIIANNGAVSMRVAPAILPSTGTSTKISSASSANSARLFQSNQSINGTSCSASTRGAIAVQRMDEPSPEQDGLCVCMVTDWSASASNMYRWHCFMH